MICTQKLDTFEGAYFLWAKQGEKTKLIRRDSKFMLSYHEAVRKYELWNGQTGGARAMLQRWERIFLEEAEGLMKERRGKANTSIRQGCPPKLDRKVEEELVAENQSLRMEIEYLKSWVP